jgi:hypothetical protein
MSAMCSLSQSSSFRAAYENSSTSEHAMLSAASRSSATQAAEPTWRRGPPRIAMPIGFNGREMVLGMRLLMARWLDSQSKQTMTRRRDKKVGRYMAVCYPEMRVMRSCRLKNCNWRRQLEGESRQTVCRHTVTRGWMSRSTWVPADRLFWFDPKGERPGKWGFQLR